MKAKVLFRMWERGIVVKEWICQEEPLIRADGASVVVGFRQMVELVRCRDCAYGTLWSGNIKCVKPGMKKYEMDLHPVNWFCADGERRSDND